MLQQLSVRGFRNLAPARIVVPPGLVAVVGANGSGKTNLLEAVAVLGNLVSFRASPPAAWVQHGAPGFVLAGAITRAGAPAKLTFQARLADRLHRTLMLGARRLATPEYLELLPVVALSARDRELVWGPPEERRRYLDRVAFHLHRETYTVLHHYRRALRQRNVLLQRGGEDAELEAFERDLAAAGGRLVAHRQAALATLEAALGQELSHLGWSLSRPVLRYHAADGIAAGEAAEVAARLRAALGRSRRLERLRGGTTVGPHRHDLVLTVGGAPAREVLSAGQGKLLATSLKLAAMAVVERVRGTPPPVVFDDVDAELDSDVLARVVTRLAGRGQAFLSSAHEEMLLPLLPAAAVWRVEAGTIRGAAEGEGFDEEGIHR